MAKAAQQPAPVVTSTTGFEEHRAWRLLLEERDQLMELRKEAIRKSIDQGWESLRRGDGIDGEAFFAALERKEQAPAEPQQTHP